MFRKTQSQTERSGILLIGILTLKTRGLWALAFLGILTSCGTPIQETKGAGFSAQTRAESSGFQATSSHADVLEFCRTAAASDSKVAVVLAGHTSEGREIPAVLLADPPVGSVEEAALDPRVKILVIANIHAGEVEAKEAVLELIRDVVRGHHGDVLSQFIVVALPNYNPDGNEARGKNPRPDQALPVEGVGKRSNGQDLDLNRDFVKAEAPETRALLRLLVSLDPILVIDGHTTDGSFHGFDLTYAAPLSPATDPAILEFGRRTFLPALRRMMANAGFATFDYGNFAREWQPPVNKERWETYDHLPRYVINGVGLRNRFGILSEAYVHAPFERRIAATKSLLVSALRLALEHRETMVRLAGEADARAQELASAGTLPCSGRLQHTEDVFLPESSVRRVRLPETASSYLADTEVHTYRWVSAYTTFAGLTPVSVPKGWALETATQHVEALFLDHGISCFRLDRPMRTAVEEFRIDRIKVARVPFQGHRLREFQGVTERIPEFELPAGTLIVPARQPLARLAFLLLEPRSEDCLPTWGIIDPVQDQQGRNRFPVRRLIQDPVQDR